MRYAFHASWIGHLYRDQVISGGNGAEAHWLVAILKGISLWLTIPHSFLAYQVPWGRPE